MVADAAAKLGIEVPVYCYHEALGPLGACRMCLVQIEKMPKLATACTTAVAEGMVVHTRGSAVDKGRSGMLEFLLINHPLDCPVCDKGGECFLQDYTFRYGPPAGRFAEPKIEKLKDAPISEFINIDQERCVLCQRCVRFMREYVGEEQLLLEGRGVETVVATVAGRPVDSQFSGNVIDLCPVGALLSRPYRYKARPWNIDREESVCPHCPVGCPAWVTGRDGRIVRTEGRPVPERDWGWLCDRGRFGYDFGYVPQRLTVSRLQGQDAPAALATREVGRWFGESLARYGPDSVGFIIGGMHSAEEARQLSAFARDVVGTSRLAISRPVPGYLPAALNGTFADINAADTVLLLGTDPYDEVPVVHLKLRERQQQQRALTVLGMGTHRLARDTLAVEDMVVEPGHQAAVLAWALNEAAPGDPALARLAEPLGDYQPPGISRQQAAEWGRRILQSEHLAILWDGEMAATESVLTALAALRAAPTRVLPTWGPANWRGFERAGISAGFAQLTGLLQDARDGKIKLLVLWGADIVRDYPDAELARAALMGAEWVVAEAVVPPLAHDLVHALLPGVGWGEEMGTYANMEGRWQVAHPSVMPPGQARPTKTYLTAWARALQKVWTVDETWPTAVGEDGRLPTPDLSPDSPAPVARPAASPPGPRLITGELIMESGMPSLFLAPRHPAFPGEIHPADAAAWGIGADGGILRLTQGDKQLEVAVRPSERIPAGRIYVPRGIRTMPANLLGPGPITAARREEVTVG